MSKKILDKSKDESQNLFEQTRKDDLENNKVKDANVAYIQIVESKVISQKNNHNSENESKNSNLGQELRDKKINYLGSSINFLSFLANSLDISTYKIITPLEIYLVISAFLKVSKEDSAEESFLKHFSLIYPDSDSMNNYALLFFYLFSEENKPKKLSPVTKKNLGFIKTLLNGIEQAKKGYSTLEVTLKIIKESKETKNFKGLKKFLDSYVPDQFSQLNDIAEKIIALLNETKLDDKYLHNWKTSIWAFIWVFRYSTQNIEVLIDDLLKKKNSLLQEFHIVLIGLFATKLFHSAPSWKPIGLSYQLYERMKVLQPAAEVFYNPGIITSLSPDPKKQEEYFWTYVWGKPYSMFENPTKKEVKKYQKKLIEVEEEVIVEEKSFGDFIKVYGEAKPTGFIRIKNF